MSIRWKKIKNSRLDPGPSRYIGDDRFIVQVLRNPSGQATAFMLSDRCNPDLGRVENPERHHTTLKSAKAACEKILVRERGGTTTPRTELLKSINRLPDDAQKRMLMKFVDFLDNAFQEVEQKIEKVQDESEERVRELRRDLRSL